MRILITAPSLNESENVSGVSTIVRTILSVDEPTLQYSHFRIGRKDGEGKGLTWIIEQLTILPRMARFIRRHRIELVHLNTDFTRASLLRDFIISSFVHRVLHRPVLLHIHGGFMLMAPPRPGSFFHTLIRRLLTQSAVAAVLSTLEREKLRLDYGVDSLILPNAVPPLPSATTTKSFSGKLHFIFLGRVVKSKGVYLIAEALKQLRDYYADFSFTLYGSGSELPKLLPALQALDGLEFYYKGVVRGTKKWEALAESHVFLLPSLYGEGLPIALLEAMQSGCVPVVSNDASITTVVQHSVNGLVVQKADLDALTDTMKQILRDPTGLERLSQNAQDTIADNFGMDHYMRRLTVCYLAAGKKTTPGYVEESITDNQLS